MSKKSTIKSKETKGTWGRTFSIFKKIKIPFVYYLLYFLLGIINTKIGILYLPYLSQMQTGRIEGASTLFGYVGFMLLGLFVGLSAELPEFYASASVMRNVQKKLFHKVLHLPIKDFEQETPSELITRITLDSEYVHNLILSILGFLSGIVTMYMALSEMNNLSDMLGLLIIPIIIYLIISVWIDGKIQFIMNRRERNSFSRTTAFFSEHMSSLINIKQLNAQSEEKKRGTEAIEIIYKTKIKNAFLHLVSVLVSGNSTTIIGILVFVFGARLVREGSMTITGLSEFYNLTIIAYGALSSVPSFYTSLMIANGQLFYVGKLLNAKEESPDGSEMPLVDEYIYFENVSFSYDNESEDGNETTLENITCTIPSGKRTALVGLNGSGKTTMLKLIERFYEPKSGKIKYGSNAVDDVNLGLWRKNFGYVLQKPRLYNASIRENIIYGVDREVSEDEIIAVSKKACAWGFIEKIPEGLDFEVGDNGCRLSQGEKQRIAIARAIMTDPAYLLLDEATSNVDVESKADIENAISSLMDGRTTVFISHDINEIKTADHIIVLNDKTVEAEGTVEELSKTSKTLNQIFNGGIV